jgi:hypothetical protein
LLTLCPSVYFFVSNKGENNFIALRNNPNYYFGISVINFIVPIFPFAYKSKPKIGKIVDKLFAD